MILADHLSLVNPTSYVTICNFDFEVLDQGFAAGFLDDPSPLLPCPVVYTEDDLFVLSLDYERYAYG